MKRAVVVLGHGSKRAEADEPMLRVIQTLKTREPEILFHAAYLEITSPDLIQAIQIVLNMGAGEVIVLPYFVQTGRHVKEHIPELVRKVREQFPTKTIHLAGHIGYDERIVSIVLDRIRETVSGK